MSCRLICLGWVFQARFLARSARCTWPHRLTFRATRSVALYQTHWVRTTYSPLLTCMATSFPVTFQLRFAPCHNRVLFSYKKILTCNVLLAVSPTCRLPLCSSAINPLLYAILHLHLHQDLRPCPARNLVSIQRDSPRDNLQNDRRGSQVVNQPSNLF